MNWKHLERRRKSNSIFFSHCFSFGLRFLVFVLVEIVKVRRLSPHNQFQNIQRKPIWDWMLDGNRSILIGLLWSLETTSCVYLICFMSCIFRFIKLGVLAAVHEPLNMDLLIWRFYNENIYSIRFDSIPFQFECNQTDRKPI